MTTTIEIEPTAKIESDTLLGIYSVAQKIKQYDEYFLMQRKAGKVSGMYYSPRGQEIIPASVAQVLRPDDYVLTIYRGIHDQIAKGVPLSELTAEFFGRVDGTCKGKGGPMHVTHPETGLIVTTGVVGSGLPIGVGVALSIQLRETDQVAIVNFGDGASNIGAFHESLNMASVWNLPAIFLCQNNRYAEYTAYRDGTAVDRIADRGASYSMRSYHVNGNNPAEIYEALRVATEEARAGNGPTLIEANTYRFNGHTPDEKMEYIPDGELAQARANDPVPMLRQSLIEQGIASEEELVALESSSLEEIKAAFEFAANSPQPDMSELYTDVYEG